MKKLTAILLMLFFALPILAQNPKVTVDKHKKDGYKEYKIDMEMGGNIKESDYINTLELKFYYKKYFSGYGDKGQMFFVQRGWENCVNIENDKKTISLIMKVDNDTLYFSSTYWSVDYWTVNGQMSDRPDRYYNASFYDIYDSDIQKILNSKSAVIIKFGIYDNFGWYFTDKNKSDIRYLLNYSREK